MGDEIDEVFDEFEDSVNMSTDELRDWKKSDQFDRYREAKSGGQPAEEPIDDAIRLLETPKDEWADEDDGFNEVEEAQELNSFVSRMSANESGEPISGTDPPLSKRDASLLSWGRDPSPRRTDFEGDQP